MIINGCHGDAVQRRPLAQIVPHRDYICNARRQLFMPTTSTPKFSKKVSVLM